MIVVRRLAEISRSDIAVAGGKGANLGELIRAGLPVPVGFVLTTAAYREFVTANGIAERLPTLAALPAGAGPEGYDVPSARVRQLFGAVDVPPAMAQQIVGAYDELGGAAVAVRSSATAEDLEGASFAGQQDSYLNVRGAGALLAAVRDCWASLWTARAMAYRVRAGSTTDIDLADVALAVVVQQMIEADAAGVMFTANPTNGRRGEAVLSAAWGLGEAVVSGSVTTDDLVVDKQTGRVKDRTTADKAVMTVYLAENANGGNATGGTEERPVPAAERRRQVLTDAEAARLTELGTRVEAHFGAPQDIEWARQGTEFWLVQARPITSLPAPEADPPTDWSVPDPKSLYVRGSIVEQLPDPLTPLFEDLIDASVTRSLQLLLREFLGANAVRDGDVALPTINGYAYYRYTRSALGRIMLRTPAAMRLLSSSGPLSGQARWRQSHPSYLRTVQSWRDRPIEPLTTVELLDGVGQLLDAGTEYYTAVQTIIPIAASSELILTQFYDRLIKRPGEPAAATLLLGYDSAPIRAEKSLYDLAAWVREHPDLTALLLSTPAADAVELTADDDAPAGIEPAVWREWRSRLQGQLSAYGHTVYNLDFANAVPADDPAPLLDTLRFYLSADRPDPYERQRRSAARRDALAAAASARLDPLRRRVFQRLLRWAQGIAPVREDALADVGLAWPQLRLMLREIGRRLVDAGVIVERDDVFWLRRAEILADDNASRADEIADRKMLWRGRLRALPPQLLPQGSVWDRFDGMMPATSAAQIGNVITGTGASAGQVTGTARVLAGPADFGRLRPGDVLVASITTPAWTTLFAMASAVVTDIGGPLSHSSIVAREYGIPAVLGTGVATRRIVDGSRVRVDGDTGRVILLDEESATEQPPASDGPSIRRGAAIGIAAVVAGAAVLLARRRRRRARSISG
jgi:pyruvate,water dikinase